VGAGDADLPPTQDVPGTAGFRTLNESAWHPHTA
jgi:hypothetical protein